MGIYKIQRLQILKFLLSDETFVYIRRSDKVNGNRFYIDQVTAEFLMNVFELESAPKYLKSESTGTIVNIDPSYLEPDEFYVVKGPGPDIITRMRKIRNQGNYRIYYLLTFLTASLV